MKKIYTLILSVCLIAPGCNDYLEQDFRSGGATSDFYGTVNGLEALVAASYVTAKVWYGKEEGFDFSDVGVDMFTYGQQHPNPEQFTFSSSFTSNSGRLTVLYIEFYKGINACNEAILYLNDDSHPMNEDLRTRREAEVKFLRALYLWHIVETWGGIAMPLEVFTSPVTSAERTSVSGFYSQIVEDLNFSVETLGEDENTGNSEFGRVTRDAALAFRARINLNMGSYIDQGNPHGFDGTADQYYQAALNDADAVLSNDRYSFYSDYEDLWALSNNSSARNSEGIWAVNYSRNSTSMMNVGDAYDPYFAGGQKPWDEREGGHHGHLMWGMFYELFDGMERDIFYGRRFRRYIPNSYLVDAYRHDIDARLDGQFRTSWLGNIDVQDPYPKWEQYDLPSGFTPPGEFIFGPGDTSIVITLDDIPDDRIAQKTDGQNRFVYVDGPYFIIDIDLLYNEDGTINTVGTDGRQLFLELSKFDDPDRPEANGDGSQRGIRDAYVFRLAEMYLIAAEAAWKTGGDGYDYLLTLADTRTKEGVTGAELLSAYGIDGNGDLSMEFFLDERAREFPGEQLRWFDLKRVFSPEDFVDRIQTYNEDTRANMEPHHYLRPIPQIQLDALTAENRAEFGQNPGY